MLLLDYLPEFFGELLEIKGLCESQQPEFDIARQEIDKTPNDFFLLTLNENGCKRWERILSIITASDDTVEMRRKRILIKYLQQLPYTYRTLINILQTWCGNDDFSVAVRNLIYELEVELGATNNTIYDTIRSVLRTVVPANLRLCMAAVYDSIRPIIILNGIVQPIIFSQTQLPQYNPLKNITRSLLVRESIACIMTTHLPLLERKV